MEAGLELKTQWKGKKDDVWSFYCPLCRAARRVVHRPAPSARHYVQLALTTAVLTLATWQWFTWKGVVAFIPLSIVFEIVFRSRARAALDCPHCGFDPYLYLIDSKRARSQIETHWKKIFAEKGIPFPGATEPAPATPVEDVPSNPN